MQKPWTCPHVIKDGAGHYCKLIPKPFPDYQHEYWRVMCLGKQGDLECQMVMRKMKK